MPGADPEIVKFKRGLSSPMILGFGGSTGRQSVTRIGAECTSLSFLKEMGTLFK